MSNTARKRPIPPKMIKYEVGKTKSVSTADREVVRHIRPKMTTKRYKEIACIKEDN